MGVTAQHSSPPRHQAALILEAALAGCRRGWSGLALCPPHHFGMSQKHLAECGNPGKVPWHSWKANQTTAAAEAEVREWFRRHPMSNYGITLGPASRLLGIDSDGPGGEVLLDHMAAGDLPPTLTFRTGGGGLRRLFKYPLGVQLRPTYDALGKHEEVRFLGLGSQTVMPPSWHPDGAAYEWVPDLGPDDIEPADAPDWMVERMRDAGGGRSTANGAAGHQRNDGGDINDGSRDSTLTSLAGTMRRRGMTPDEIEAALLVVNEKRCKPPLPESTVRKIAKSVGRYDPEVEPTIRFSASVSGSNGGTAGNGQGHASGPPGRDETDGKPQLGYQIILTYFRAHYRPQFRSGNTVRTGDGRDLQMGEACAVLTSQLVAQLATATDAPQFKGGGVNVNALPGFYKTWAKVAWGDLLQSLPDEDTAELGKVGSARDEFRQMVRDTLLSECTLSQTTRTGPRDVESRIERDSLINWCRKFAKPGPWRSIRGKQCWCRLVEVPGAAEGEVVQVLRVAVRHGIFAQVKADRRLTTMGTNKFTRRAARYDVGTTSRDDRVHGQSAVVLLDDFVAELVDITPKSTAENLADDEKAKFRQGGQTKNDDTDSVANDESEQGL